MSCSMDVTFDINAGYMHVTPHSTAVITGHILRWEALGASTSINRVYQTPELLILADAVSTLSFVPDC